MRMNAPVKTPKQTTFEGGRAYKQTPKNELTRAVCACLLWENSFYESGEDIGTRLTRIAAGASTQDLIDVAVTARNVMQLRHAPLLLLAELGRREGSAFGETAPKVIMRADELGEFVAIFGRKMPSRVKRGLAKCFHKFSEYQFAKYKGTGNKFSLRDVMFLVHPRPNCFIDGEWSNKAELFKKIANNTLETPDTWEVEISAKGNNAESWTRLIKERKLGALALLRNLRNMIKAGVDPKLVAEAIETVDASRVLPFRYVAAANAAPEFVRSLDKALCKSIDSLPQLDGRTAILVDVSGSMDAQLSSKSDMTRIDAAAALGACYPGNCDVYSFSYRLERVKGYRGLPGIDAIKSSQPHGGTNLAEALQSLPVGYDRIIVITDEQASPGKLSTKGAKNFYVINVASYQNSIVHGDMVSITGFSENVFRYIHAHESMD